MGKTIALIDSGVSNIHNIQKAVGEVGFDSKILCQAESLDSFSHVVFPGVGGFSSVKESLERSGLWDCLLDHVSRQRPMIGICVGMQMLFEKSFEFGEHSGYHFISGQVSPLSQKKLLETAKVPNVGWSPVKFVKDENRLGLTKGSSEYFYFTHSFAPYGVTQEAALGVYDGKAYEAFPALVCKDNLVGCQFHLELSGPVGLSVLRNFIERF